MSTYNISEIRDMKKYSQILELVRGANPLVHQITNYVTVNDCANMTICFGAAPVMSHAPKDVIDLDNIASALVLNIGTLDENQIEGMLAAKKNLLKMQTASYKIGQILDRFVHYKLALHVFALSEYMEVMLSKNFQAEYLSKIEDENLGENKSLILDFKKLEYISSAGLRVLLSTQKKLQQKGTMKLKNVREEVMEVFEMTGFADILTIE